MPDHARRSVCGGVTHDPAHPGRRARHAPGRRTHILGRFGEQLEAIDRTRDYPAKRRTVELLVTRIRVDTETVDGRKSARLTIYYAFAASRSRAGFSIGTPTTEPYSVHEPS